MYAYIYIYIHTHVCVYIYIYIILIMLCICLFMYVFRYPPLVQANIDKVGLTQICKTDNTQQNVQQ